MERRGLLGAPRSWTGQEAPSLRLSDGGEHGCADALISDLQPPERKGNECLLFKPPLCGVFLWQPGKQTQAWQGQHSVRRALLAASA